MNSLGRECNELKGKYDDCFNVWFSQKFLKGDTNEDMCKVEHYNNNKWQKAEQEIVCKNNIYYANYYDLIVYIEGNTIFHWNLGKIDKIIILHTVACPRLF